ncbi:ABC transporter ATP-binding protein [Chelatococcus composti]|jgi:spermidine/putrescine ABC transporter ATP-binding subunit|uniref:Spermidine/putrescine import ATP-binding protein PotA n=1 Tax=Chelatococcus composti TaxID=1743235 RepID=A0A841K7Z8_9HYPH|nr:ABC transporter ATP-binding protein [Chelatococcus composti]MBB6168627.1 putative spermidine/putrescine transport system ATP-binding protein [Chelatococcus composti]MBS7736294.1 ABC transporter ATP-binding protein [Chelatococcus composti]PZN44888.1 MAG: Fe3+/spermidine/putrescine ABC transporter ATP-binding protein [Pseudomonadota bacterium]GGG41486.1 polyamine-transporting ATPase [Chelatococcus composti]
MGAFIAFKNVTKKFGALTVVDNLDLEIAKGEFVSLLGPSGSGKTTLLMMLAGFERPTSGEIFLDGKPITHLPPHRRQMGMVFQNYALFPHMTVAENVAFPLEMQRVPRAEIVRRVERALDMVRLGALKDRKPSQLSGGQQQRVALTRALVFEPDVILMDEPLGALDKQLREHMQLEIRDLHRRLGLTIVFVTHDQSEALTMSDRIAVFNAGKIEQIDTPQMVYDRPRTRFVAEFIGETNLVAGKVVDAGGERAVVRVGDAALSVCGNVQPGRDVSLSLRPERIRLGSTPAAANALPVTVADCIYHGDHMRLVLKSGSLELVARAERLAGDWPVGTEAVASFDPQDCTVLAS